jgi:hypothetical protein
MPFKSNTFEGGTDGTIITTANSGDVSGTPWDLVQIGAVDATAEFDNARASQGTKSARLVSAATAAVVQLRWSFDEIPELFTRFYLYLPSTVALPVRLLFVETAGFTQVARYEIADSAGTPVVRIYSEGDFANAVGTVAVTRDAWIRYETWVKLGSSGLVQAKLFNSLDISTADDIVSINPYASTNLTAGRVRFGWNAAVANREYWLDSIAMETSGYMGPYSVPADNATRRVVIA